MERDEDLVLGPPRVGGLGRRRCLGDDPLARLLLPVDLAVVDEVRAAVAEALGEHRLPVLPRVRRAEQLAAQRLVAVDGADDEVVPRLAVEVDDDGVEAERPATAAATVSSARGSSSALSIELAASSCECRRAKAASEPLSRGAWRDAAAETASASGWWRWGSSSSACSAATTAGSNWEPAQASSSARASAARIARR